MKLIEAKMDKIDFIRHVRFLMLWTFFQRTAVAMWQGSYIIRASCPASELIPSALSLSISDIGICL